MEEVSDSSRSHSKRDVEDTIDATRCFNEDEERYSVDGRKSGSGKLRRDSSADELEEPDDGMRRSADRNESRRKSVSRSGQACSGNEVDYDAKRVSRVSKVPRRSPEERGEERSSDGYKDRDGDSSRRRREDEHDWDSSRRSRSRSSDHDASHSKSISKAEKPYDGKHAKGIQSLERRECSKEKQGDLFYQRSANEAYSDLRADGSDKSDTRDGKSSLHESKHRSELGESLEDSERRNSYGTIKSNDQDGLSVDPRCESGSHVVREDKHVSIQGRMASSVDDIGNSNDNVETRDKFPCLDEDGRALSKYGKKEEARDDKKYPVEKDVDDRDHLDSDDERSISMKEKTREYAHADSNSYKGRERNRELEGSKEYLMNRQKQDSKESTDYDAVTDWRHGQERLDGGNFHNRPGSRKDSRGRYEGNKGPSSYGNRYDSSDSIEIRPNRNLDFGRASSVSVRRSDMGSHHDLMPGTNDPSAENKTSYGSGQDSHERYYEDAQNIDHDPANDQSDSQSGRGGLKGAMTPNTKGAGESGSGSMISPIPQQGPKGGRPSRAIRGRLNGRDPQRVGIPVPMMPPSPFGPLGLPPGPMQQMGPNMSHSPGPLGPGVFMPPFPGPLLWPGARGVDMSMLALTPNLPMPPQVAGPRFTTSVGAGPSHNIHLHQTGTGRGPASGSGFSPMATPCREMMHDKPHAGWTPQRNSGSAGKAPSRGEQNDYSQNFVDTGMRPQNFIRELELTNVVEDYPKLRELIQRKDEIVSNSASAPMYYKCDLKEHALSPEFFGTNFDVILVDPPWEEYVHRAPGITDDIEYWTPEEIMNLKIEAIADTPSFIFLWVGDGVGLEQGRQCLKKWGFRRCEDICWVKTNKKNATPGLRHDSNTLFQHSKEHCLMGIKGTVRRSTDGHIIHANIDTDIIIAEEPTDGSTKKPEDMYRIIEHFALGRRRLELFGEDHNIRPGWLTLGKALSSSNFSKEAYTKNFLDRDGKVWQGNGGRNPPPDTPHLVVTTPEIESLRPKSPPHKNQQHQSISVPAGSSSNRRSGVGTPQNAVTVVGSETVMPPGWSSTLKPGFGIQEGGAGHGSNPFDSFGFTGAPYGRPIGDRIDFDTHRLL